MRRICCLLCPVAWGAEPAGPEAKPLVLAVHPDLPSPEIQQRFGPMAKYLGRLLGRPVVGRDYDEHIDARGTNTVDIAFMGPAQYVLLVAHYGRKPLLARLETNGTPLLSGVIITRADSALADLKGKRFAFGERNPP